MQTICIKKKEKGRYNIYTYIHAGIYVYVCMHVLCI
jgi:hypothetical protein